MPRFAAPNPLFYIGLLSPSKLDPNLLADRGQHGIKFPLIDQSFHNSQIVGNIVQAAALDGKFPLPQFQRQFPVFDLQVNLAILIHPEPSAVGLLPCFVGLN